MTFREAKAKAEEHLLKAETYLQQAEAVMGDRDQAEFLGNLAGTHTHIAQQFAGLALVSEEIEAAMDAK